MDIEQKMAEGKGRGYERWAKIHNLKQAAKTLSVYQQYGFTSPEQLEAAVDTAYQKMRQTSGELKALETKLQGKKKLQRQVLAYAQTKAARDGLRAQKSEKARAAYRQAHESDFIIADAAARYFKAHGITKLPARKALQAEIEQLKQPYREPNKGSEWGAVRALWPIWKYFSVTDRIRRVAGRVP